MQVFKKVQVSVCGSGTDLLNFLLCVANKTHFKYTLKKARESLERLDLRTTSSARRNFPAKKKNQKPRKVILKMFLQIFFLQRSYNIIEDKTGHIFVIFYAVSVYN